MKMGYPRKRSSKLLDRYLETNPKPLVGNQSKELEHALLSSKLALHGISWLAI
jgi:hypothetical protein